MNLYLAEKPSQARDIAAVLGIEKRGDGFLQVKGGDKVTYAVGHLYELAAPEEYNPDWGGYWKWAQLPLIPEQFKLKPYDKTKGQLKVIKELLKQATTVVIATDAGREGELIARDILANSKYKGKVKRFWTSSLTEKDIAAKLQSLKDGSETYALYEAGSARRHADWMYGLTLTRAASLASKHRGDYYPVGRVQTAVLAMVVRRNEAVRAFTSSEYFELEAVVQTVDGTRFKMLHAPAEDKRMDRATAELLLVRASGHAGPLKVETVAGKEAPPLPYSLPQLQKDASRIFGFSAKSTLQLAQTLYEKKATTYPRTDCNYLAESQKDDVGPTLSRLNHLHAPEVASLHALGITLRASTFNDAKLTDHHAIIPTAVSVTLQGQELQLFTLIAQRYLQTLAPDCLFNQTRVSVDANGVLFKASGKAVTNEGWTGVRLLGSASDAA